MNNRLPKHVAKYFWGDDLSQLNLKKHKTYIAKTLLEKGDKEEVMWLLSQIDRQKLKNQLPLLKLTPKSENFWQLFLQ